MNEWIGIGRLTRNPELSYTQSNTARCTFTIAIDRPSRNGEKEADFIRIVCWNKQAETCERYLKQGSQCAVRGEIRTGSYKDKDGRTVFTTDVWANRVEFLGSPKQAEQKDDRKAPETFQQKQEAYNLTFSDLPDSFSTAEDDIPF